MPRKNSFRALPILSVLVVLSVLSFVVFQSYPPEQANIDEGSVFGLSSDNLPIPIHPKGQILSESKSDGRSYYTIKAKSSAEGARQWYNTKLKEEGFNTNGDYIYTRGNERIELSILEATEGETILLINYIY